MLVPGVPNANMGRKVDPDLSHEQQPRQPVEVGTVCKNQAKEDASHPSTSCTMHMALEPDKV